MTLGQSVAEVLEWDDRTIATALQWLEEKRDAEKDAARQRR